MRYDVVIVGGGHGGAQAAIALRQAKFEGSVAILGDEPELPYERPPLSKEYLSGTKSFERILLRPAQFWIDRQIDILTGFHVTKVDAAAHILTTANGETVEYGKLIWATGGTARRLSCEGKDLHGVHTVRTRADADRMMVELPEVSRVVVVGGGFIGLEAAAVLAKAGKRVILIEALDRLLARVAGETISAFFEKEHRAHGVEVRLGASVEAIEGVDGKVTAVRLAGGDHVPADMVIVGIGIVPAISPLANAGAETGNGVLVDEACRTSLQDVFAIGDCAAHPNRFADGQVIRLESVQNANDQAGVVARHLLGQTAVYDAVPWFWSNQYDIRLQTIGLSSGHDAAILRGDPSSRSFSVIYLLRGRVIALDCVNATKDYVQGRRLVVDRLSPPPALLADTSIPLKEVSQDA